MFAMRILGNILFALTIIPILSLSALADDSVEIAPNGSFEIPNAEATWPAEWSGVKVGGSWETEDGNRFLRLKSPQPGEMVMLYQEIKLPTDVSALKLTWKQRVSDLKKGKNSWFDARIMLEFIDDQHQKVSPTPSAAATGKDTAGWVEREVEFLVPEGAYWLKFMPALFQVESGTFDLDDISLKPIDPAPLREEMERKAQERLAKQQTDAAKRREKAQATLEQWGSLIPNGSFTEQTKGLPTAWGKMSGDLSWQTEGENTFLRIHSSQPGKLAMLYRTFDIPAGTTALELTWKQRISELKTGKMPWHDARIMIEFQGTDGKKLAGKPSPAYTQKNTDGWVEKSKAFLVPEDALTVILMPSLFEVTSGTLDIDDLTLKPASPEPLLAAAKLREEEAKMREVPREEPNPANWPKMLKVVGNRVQDTDGNDVWLQGVNAGGLETLPQDKQQIKSTVVAIDEWKANCVRVPIKDEFWYGQSPYQNDGGKEYRETIDRIVNLAANRGAYVVLDLHRYRAPKQEYADFWKDCATVYKNHPVVLFDLLNEPHGITWEVWRNGGFVGTKSGTDESAFLDEEDKTKNQGFESIGMQALVDAVRSTGAKNIVIAGGLAWCNDLTGIAEGYALDDPTGNGIMYSWHTYHWHTDWEKRVLPAAAKYPIFLGEVGADIKKMDFIPAEAQEDPYTWVPDMLGFIQKHHIHWTGWCFHPKASPIMISDWKYTPTPFWGQFAKDALGGKKFELKRTR
ncbi:glycoside hydrolase family 5 [Blastopirellula marina]|uniref:Glycoside hydrolase family 5 n=1 Tax=Blastopirellula marina TaxID=124 RepID=A0A2S8FM04_9BACT|nr:MULTISPECIES: cellulase family glycosylhydrolase [Pirellulaceae]PQO33187.1 glycoside hydrolase family 5 [Blastopirellula marina]RCS52276.1 glycoside hydrolase family 5 protein [Bremerella cremea]